LCLIVVLIAFGITCLAAVICRRKLPAWFCALIDRIVAELPDEELETESN